MKCKQTRMQYYIFLTHLVAAALKNGDWMVNFSHKGIIWYAEFLKRKDRKFFNFNLLIFLA